MTADREPARAALPLLSGELTPMARLLFAALLVAIVAGTLTGLPALGASRDVWAGLAAFAIVAGLLLALRRPHPASLLIAAAAAAALQALEPSGPALLAAIGVVVVANRGLPAPIARRLGAAAALAFLGTEVAARHALPTGELLSQAMSLFFSYAATATFADLRREQRHTATLLQEVLAGRDAQVRAAALDERARLAREMHDILAHTLAALSIQLEGARLLAAQRSGDPALVGTLDRAAALAKEGLAEARRAVGSLRDEVLPGPERIPALAASFERDTGVPCTVRLAGEAGDLAPEARLALYRVTQEALTNIQKHAEASFVEVDLRYAEREVSLTVSDRGRPRAASLPGGGHGLRGMRERAALLGGRLEAGPTQDGYRVSLWIPR